MYKAISEIFKSLFIDAKHFLKMLLIVTFRAVITVIISTIFLQWILNKFNLVPFNDYTYAQSAGIVVAFTYLYFTAKEISSHFDNK